MQTMTSKDGKCTVDVHPTRVEEMLGKGWTKDKKDNKVKTVATGSDKKS